jgi:predicted RNA-binding Zn ribbon-like protein
VLALEFIDRASDAAMTDAASATAWLAERRIRSALPAGCEGELAELRRAIENLLRSAADGGPPSAAALDCVNAASAAAPVAEQLDWPEGGRRRRWLATSAPPQQHVMALLARSAMALVADDAASLLRECEAPRCGRIFAADNSRRRWCSVACGNRVRVARHAARRRPHA